MKKFSNIPTNIITGFLGVGKTSAIRHLLKTKPPQEKWAVLVNEFGEVGIDGALLRADNIAVTEVPGGCMCCAVGLPSKVAMNNLIRQYKPDRILIEPTGLAHPKQVLQQFSGPEFSAVLNLQAVVCLVDPWCLSDPQFSSLAAFNDQIAMADVLLASKADIADTQHLKIFRDFCDSYQPRKQYCGEIKNGQLDWRLLQLPRLDNNAGVESQVHHHDTSHDKLNIEFDQQGVACLESQTEFAYACGWRFRSDWRFDSDKLHRYISGLEVPRIKGVFATADGWLGINKMRHVVSLQAIDSGEDSRLEMIAMDVTDWPAIDQALRQCRVVSDSLPGSNL